MPSRRKGEKRWPRARESEARTPCAPGRTRPGRGTIWNCPGRVASAGPTWAILSTVDHRSFAPLAKDSSPRGGGGPERPVICGASSLLRERRSQGEHIEESRAPVDDGGRHLFARVIDARGLSHARDRLGPVVRRRPFPRLSIFACRLRRCPPFSRPRCPAPAAGASPSPHLASDPELHVNRRCPPHGVEGARGKRCHWREMPRQSRPHGDAILRRTNARS